MHNDLITPTQSHDAALSSQSASVKFTKVNRIGLPIHGYWGIAIMLLGEALMFAKIEPVPTWFTPIQWTGYILLLDALLLRWRGESFIFDRTREFVLLLIVSIACWFLFEAYNLHLRNWAYHNLPENMVVRLIGFFWAFATIFPGILMTSEVIDELGIFRRATFSPVKVPNWTHQLLLVTGALCCIVPVLVPAALAKYLFAFVWIGFVLLLDPINYRLGMPSLLRDLEKGSVQKLLSLFLSGLVCGILWEFWNYWAKAKWVYTVPYLDKPKIFEMPLYGFLGFLPFAAECFVMWQLALYFVLHKK
ncbi:MAG: hypothetical protein ONB44_14205 [candidate division KSB1 bacterium]|nr:hypothetical protein [candidate division KSB1 bacterium]MDZ7303278.1 hypothetical protein [candidate division KSB1 bacterium]MDZ7312582.1 hypothetical protein [candidate division KSB1 bacterium]